MHDFFWPVHHEIRKQISSAMIFIFALKCAYQLKCHYKYRDPYLSRTRAARLQGQKWATAKLTASLLFGWSKCCHFNGRTWKEAIIFFTVIVLNKSTNEIHSGMSTKNKQNYLLGLKINVSECLCMAPVYLWKSAIILVSVRLWGSSDCRVYNAVRITENGISSTTDTIEKLQGYG